MISERLGLILAYLLADSLFPVSAATYNDMYKSRFRGRKIKTVKCGVNLSEIESLIDKGQEKIYDAVFLKRIQAVKGIFDLIDIWEIVVKKLPQEKLIIIGNGIDEVEAKKLVTEKKLDENIKFLGAIYDLKEKYNYLAQSKLFLLPSYEENWAIVVGEALACGTPVMVYRLKELEEVWKDSITYINISNKEAFAEKIVDFLTNNSEYEERSRQGIEYVKQYDWAQIAFEEMDFILKN